MLGPVKILVDIPHFSAFSKFTLVNVRMCSLWHAWCRFGNFSVLILGDLVFLTNGQNFRCLGWLVFEISMCYCNRGLRLKNTFRADTTVQRDYQLIVDFPSFYYSWLALSYIQSASEWGPNILMKKLKFKAGQSQTTFRKGPLTLIRSTSQDNEEGWGAASEAPHMGKLEIHIWLKIFV